MNKFLLSLACLLGAFTASAQVEPQLGVRLSWDLNAPVTNLNDNVDFLNNGSGFSVGAFYDIPVYGALYFEPGLSFFYNTIGISDIIVNAENAVIDGSLRNVGFRIPLVAGYRFDFTDDIALSVFTGPQLNIGLSLKQHINMPEGLKDYKDILEDGKQYYGNGWHRLDMQWLFGVRFHYQDNFFAELTGGPGMTNIMGGKDFKGDHLRRNVFSIGVGYIF